MRQFLSIVVALGLAGCGGIIEFDYNEDNGTALQKFFLTDLGECVLPDGSACLDMEPESTGTPENLDNPDNPELVPEEGGCWVTGIGTFGKGNTRDSFGGNGMTMKDGRVRGEWQHTDHYDETETQKNGQNLFHGDVHFLACMRFPTLNGPEVPKAIPNYATWGGVGRYNGVDGFHFQVKAFDHAEGGIHRDRYQIEIFDADWNLVLHADGQGTMTEPSNKQCLEDETVTDDIGWVKDLGCLSGGNFQIHPPNQGHPYPPPPDAP